MIEKLAVIVGDWRMIASPPLIHKTFLFWPKKTVTGDLICGQCYKFWSHFRSGSDAYYLSKEDAMLRLMTGEVTNDYGNWPRR